MEKNRYPQDQLFWNLKRVPSVNLRDDLKTDVVVVGGGVAGLSAAQSFRKKGFSVVLLEKYFCGAGASGKSSGFITPYAELGFQFFVNQFGPLLAKRVWEFGTSGVEFIRKNIETFAIDCDFQKQDVLVVANSHRTYKQLEKDHNIDQASSTKSTLYSKESIQTILGSKSFFGGIRYPDTFAINCYDYCQSMKDILLKNDVLIYEESPAIEIKGNSVKTPYGSVTAEHIIVCVDRFLPELGALSQQVFQAQTFIAVSEPLSHSQITRLFPQDKLMLWDTDLIYTYFRIIDNNRFLIGGSDYVSISWGREQHNQRRIYNKFDNYVKAKFPYLNTTFSYMWPGLIGTSKDIIPLAGEDSNNPHVYYITCAAGLPWAAALGNYSAERVANGTKEFDDFFSYKRAFPISNALQTVIGKRAAFSLSNFINLYFRN